MSRVPVRVERGKARVSEALQQVRETALALSAEGRTDEAHEVYLSALESVLWRNHDLELLLEKLRRQAVGKRSERIDPAQLALMFEELERLGDECPSEEACDPEDEARGDAELEREIKEAERQSAPDDNKARKRGDWSTTGRPEVHIVEVAAEQRRCDRCGGERSSLGHDVTRRLEFVPARFVEHEYRLEKVACPRCKDRVETAQAPPQVIDRSPASASLLAQLVVSKYVNHLPLHRQSRVFERLGARLPVSTLCDWVAYVGDALEPLADKLAESVLGSYIVRTDATGLKVLDPTSPGNIQRGTIWCYAGDDKHVLFRYTETGEGETGPWSFLQGRTGFVQADAASVFDRVFNGKAGNAKECGCWSHGRRKLADLVETDSRVAYPLKEIQRLFRIEKLAKLRRLTPDQRLELRKQRSQRPLDKLKRWFVVTTKRENPSSPLAKAGAYFINHWEALGRFMTDGRIDIENNFTERQLRDIAVGRKNYLFAGSHDAARRTATIYSLMRTCALCDVDPLAYLTDVLARLAAGWKQDRLTDLLPDRWQELPTGDAERQDGRRSA